MKRKDVIKNIFIVLLILLVSFIINTLGILTLVSIDLLLPADKISGIENYDKSYYITKYGGDLDSNLSIFPNNTSKMLDATFVSSFQTNLFDSNGYIILVSKYNEDDFNQETSRLSELNITISNGKNKSYTNYIKNNNKYYEYPAFITIDGYGHTYEYALINQESFEIVYIYLSYPDINNPEYKQYLKKDKSEYLKNNTLNKYSMYNHSFDNGKSFIEYNDC